MASSTTGVSDLGRALRIGGFAGVTGGVTGSAVGGAPSHPKALARFGIFCPRDAPKQRDPRKANPEGSKSADHLVCRHASRCCEVHCGSAVLALKISRGVCLTGGLSWSLPKPSKGMKTENSMRPRKSEATGRLWKVTNTWSLWVAGRLRPRGYAVDDAPRAPRERETRGFLGERRPPNECSK